MAAQLSEIGAFARKHDPDRFLCALFAPPGPREALFALIGYHHELGRAREAASNPVIAAIRLQWWRDALEQPRRHEVATPLREAIAAGLLDPADLLVMADAREAELEEEGIASRAAFGAYLRGSHGGYAVAAGRMLGATGPDLAALQAIGAAQGLAALLRATPALAARGRCLLPIDALFEAGIDIYRAVAEPALLAPVIRTLALPPAPARNWPVALVPAALPAILARRDLARLARGSPARRGTLDRLALLAAAWRRQA